MEIIHFCNNTNQKKISVNFHPQRSYKYRYFLKMLLVPFEKILEFNYRILIFNINTSLCIHISVCSWVGFAYVHVPHRSPFLLVPSPCLNAPKYSPLIPSDVV